jgi:hypothetical protein
LRAGVVRRIDDLWPEMPMNLFKVAVGGRIWRAVPRCGIGPHCKEGPIGGVKREEVAQKQQKIEIKKA